MRSSLTETRETAVSDRPPGGELKHGLAASHTAGDGPLSLSTGHTLTYHALTDQTLTRRAFTEQTLTRRALTDQTLTCRALTDWTPTCRALTDQTSTCHAITDQTLTCRALTDQTLTFRALTDQCTHLPCTPPCFRHNRRHSRYCRHKGSSSECTLPTSCTETACLVGNGFLSPENEQLS